MQYARNIETDEPIMMLDKRIGGTWSEDDGFGIDGASWAAELMQLDAMGKKRIQVWINSIGGSVIDGYNICNAILKTKTKVDTYCVGIAASMAAVVFQCGRRRIMADYGILMYHNPYNAAPDENASDAKVTEAMKESLNTMICERSGMDQQAMGLMMDRTTFINAIEAQEMKLCDEVEATAGLNAPRMKADSVQNSWKAANKVLNQIFDNKKPNTMKLVMNTLGLNVDAAEDSAVQAIQAIKNQLTEKDTEIANLQAQIAEKETAATNSANELKALQDQLDALKAEKEAADAATLEANATTMVNKFAAQGRIKNDDVTLKSWVNAAVKDMTGTQAMLESLPLNKAAVTIAVEPKAGEVSTSATGLMAKVMNNLKKNK